MARRQGLATTGLVALLVVDIALVLLAMRNPFRTTADSPTPLSSSGATSGATAGATSAAGVSAGANPSGASSTAAGSGPGTVGLVAFDANKALRFTRGSCPGGGATLGLTTDGGKTWRAIPSPLPAISSVTVTDDSKFQLIGATDGCQSATRRTVDAGKTWATAGNWSGWYANPGNAVQVVSAADKTQTPCGSSHVAEVQAVSATSAHVLCATSKLLETADGGTTWVDASRALEVLAVDDTLVGGKAVATIAYRTDSCAGLQLGTLTGSTLAKLGCAQLGSVDATIGSVALGVHGQQVWLLAGAGTWLSGDGGATWAAAS